MATGIVFFAIAALGLAMMQAERKRALRGEAPHAPEAPAQKIMIWLLAIVALLLAAIVDGLYR